MSHHANMLYDSEHFLPALAPFERRLNTLGRTAPALSPAERTQLRRFGFDSMPLTGRQDVYEGAALIVHGEPYIVVSIDFAAGRIVLNRSRACRKHTLTVTPERLAELLAAEETRHAAA